jgi:GT2 family glycosyltransferase
VVHQSIPSPGRRVSVGVMANRSTALSRRLARVIAALQEVVARQPKRAAIRSPSARLPGDWQPFDASIPVELTALHDGPLVSVVTVCRNAARFLPRAIASVKAQDYRNIEYLIQDGASTDRTRSVVAAEGLSGGFVSEPDLCALDGLLKAARRARGDYIAVCWADDELLPHAVRWGMDSIRHADVIYGDQVVDRRPADSAFVARSAPWDPDRFLQGEFFPSFPSSFYRRDVLVKLGERLTVFDHDEWEYWVRLGRLGRIRYVPGVAALFHVHGKTQWVGKRAAAYVATQVKGRKRAIADLGLSRAMQRRAEMGAELWAALHLTGWAKHALPAICGHTERALALANGDYRFGLLLKRLQDAR